MRVLGQRQLHLGCVRRLGGDRRLSPAPEHQSEQRDRRPARQRRLRLARGCAGGRGDRHGCAGGGRGAPDGGAAFTTIGGPDGPRVYEREAAGAPWQADATPLPGVDRGPGRAVPRRRRAARDRLRPAGSATKANRRHRRQGSRRASSNRLRRSRGGPESGGVLRQTASGWSDEGHELNPCGRTAGQLHLPRPRPSGPTRSSR